MTVRALPSAVVVGPMKTGTTWLDAYLRGRSDVCLPAGVKETFYFDRRFDKPLEWYARHFRHFDSERHRLVCEVGASYFPSADAPARIADVLGPVTVIVLLRDPVARAWSHYAHLRRMGHTRLPLVRAVEAFPDILEGSRYTRVLRRWQAVFSAERVRTLAFDELRADPPAFCRSACAALGLSFVPAAPEADFEKNESAQPRWPLLSDASRRAADALRSRQLYWLVNLGKQLGLKRVVFGTSGHNRLELSADDRQLLEERLHDELLIFPRLSADAAGSGSERCRRVHDVRH